MSETVMWIIVVVAVLVGVFWGPIKSYLETKYGTAKVKTVESALSSAIGSMKNEAAKLAQDVKDHVTNVVKSSGANGPAQTPADATVNSGANGPAQTPVGTPQSAAAPATTISDKRADIAKQIASLQQQDASLQALDDQVKKALS